MALGLASAGCTKQPPPDHPVDAYLAFARAAERDPKSGYEALSKKSREVLAEKTKQLSDAADGSILNEPAYVFFGRPGKAPAIADVKLVEEQGDVATLKVTAGGQVEDVKMVREDSRWRVDLTDKLVAETEKAPAEEQAK